jgi:hypothetical protein
MVPSLDCIALWIIRKMQQTYNERYIKLKKQRFTFVKMKYKNLNK